MTWFLFELALALSSACLTTGLQSYFLSLSDSLTEPTVNMTNPDPEREERKGADQVKKEENGQSTTTVIEVTESYPEAGTEAFIVRMTSVLTHDLILLVSREQELSSSSQCL